MLFRSKAVSLGEAHVLYRQYENRFKKIKAVVEENSFDFNGIRKLDLRINNSNYKVDIREVGQ